MGSTAWHDAPGSLWDADADIQDRHRRRCHALGAMMGAGERALCQRVLHIACGCGYCARCFAEIGLVDSDGYLGIDVERERIKVALDHLPDLAFRVADPEGGLPQGPFDLVIADSVLEHLSDPKGFLKRLRRRVTALARVLIAVPYRQPASSPQVSGGYHLMYDVDEQRLGNLLEPEFTITEAHLWQAPELMDSAGTGDLLMAKARVSGPEFLLLSRPEELAEAIGSRPVAPHPAGG